MESALAVYFFSLSLIFLSKNIILFSFLSFLSILSRLEFLIFYFFILSYELFFKKKILILNYFLKILFLPLLIILYLCINFILFEYILPESGLAKSLTKEIKINLETFSFLKSNSYGMKFISILFLINCIGIFFLFSKKLNVFTKLTTISTALFFLSNSIRSSWPLWTWHFLFLAISTPFLISDFIKFVNFKYKNSFAVLFGVFFVTVYSYLLSKNHNINNDHILNLAVKIQNHYEKSNHKVFAMGDMAGKVSYLLGKNLIQLEGLVGGKKVLQRIQNEESLCDLFNDLNVNIYFVSKFKKVDESYLVEEPSQPSKNLRKMRALLDLEPEKIFKSGELKILSFNVNDRSKCKFVKQK
jgi:hypothetical protein